MRRYLTVAMILTLWLVPAMAPAAREAPAPTTAVDQASCVTAECHADVKKYKVLHGPVDLRNYLTSHPDQFPMTVTKRLMMYAPNREIEYYDMPEIRKIVHSAAASNYSMNDIIKGIVNSDPFRRQGAEAPAKAKVASNLSSERK